MKLFKSHSVSKICHEHFDGISYICMKCVKAVCVKCVALDHADHIVDQYSFGVDNLKDCLNETMKKVKGRQTWIEKCRIGGYRVQI